MAFRYYPDGNGDTMKLYDEDGRLMHVILPAWDSVTQMTSREDDVLICSYPRSGTHWVWEIVHLLKTGKTQVTTLDMKSHMLLACDVASLDEMDSPRVLTTHRQFQDLPSEFIIKKRKMVLVLRDPKDACVSWYKLLLGASILEYSGTFDGFITLYLQGKVPCNSWTSWVKSFEKGFKEHPELTYHVVRYEQLLQDPVKEIRRLAEYLEVDPSLADTVAEQTQFSVMRNVKIHNDLDDFAKFFSDNRCNTHVFYKGKSGVWKEWFNEEQQKQFDDYICKQLGRPSIQPLL